MNNYSGSKCPKCEKTEFELIEDTPLKANYKLWFIRCSSCKTVVGVRDFHNTEYLLVKLARALDIDESKFPNH